MQVQDLLEQFGPEIGGNHWNNTFSLKIQHIKRYIKRSLNLYKFL